MDFGCITIDPTLKLYLFGTPGQDRFGFMWDDIVEGAVGGLVIVDNGGSTTAMRPWDYFEHTGHSRSRSPSTPSTARWSTT